MRPLRGDPQPPVAEESLPSQFRMLIHPAVRVPGRLALKMPIASGAAFDVDGGDDGVPIGEQALEFIDAGGMDRLSVDGERLFGGGRRSFVAAEDDQQRGRKDLPHTTPSLWA